jgi:hypothetical protein
MDGQQERDFGRSAAVLIVLVAATAEFELPQIHNVLPAAFHISHPVTPPPSCRWQASIEDLHADHVTVRAASDVTASHYDCCC